MISGVPIDISIYYINGFKSILCELIQYYAFYFN
jgi:hypothetical protein